ncbi:ACP S-malonyltransferase [Pseudalkalibacillus caeni]|uniref:Malonyl CoA-acyl carrier protein transacylase n=1 Tax=Exobacillus caeni TaxID=2574798 RepID=A0A5R9F123_9BACL|nr:ACP S-malonyltransferase [Pseudalkalibacillus caeni]TLS37332.1 ACP S-malonyltransferase [Pseudalkalibacillus caeni]
MGKIAFLFPGQGSQFVGMGKAIADQNERAASIFKAADERLDFSLSDIIFNGPLEKLTLTENTQPAILTASIAVLKALEDEGIKADYTAGHSLGEYSALVASNALSFEDAVYAVRNRGLFMEEAVPAGQGAMAAILGMEREDLQQLTDQISEEGSSVQLANLNCPGQIVISGSREGVEAASERAKEKGARRVIPLQVSGPFHSELMTPAAERLKPILDDLEIKEADIPVVANVSAEAITKPEEIHTSLLKQIYSPVLWEDTVRKLLDLGVETFIEIGPGNVLSGLVKKVHRRAATFAVGDPESLEKALNKLREER